MLQAIEVSTLKSVEISEKACMTVYFDITRFLGRFEKREIHKQQNSVVVQLQRRGFGGWYVWSITSTFLFGSVIHRSEFWL